MDLNGPHFSPADLSEKFSEDVFTFNFENTPIQNSQQFSGNRESKKKTRFSPNFLGELKKKSLIQNNQSYLLGTPNSESQKNSSTRNSQNILGNSEVKRKSLIQNSQNYLGKNDSELRKNTPIQSSQKYSRTYNSELKKNTTIQNSQHIVGNSESKKSLIQNSQHIVGNSESQKVLILERRTVPWPSYCGCGNICSPNPSVPTYKRSVFDEFWDLVHGVLPRGGEWPQGGELVNHGTQRNEVCRTDQFSSVVTGQQGFKDTGVHVLPGLERGSILPLGSFDVYVYVYISYLLILPVSLYNNAMYLPSLKKSSFVGL